MRSTQRNLVAVCVVCLQTAASAGADVTLESLLGEMTDYTALARWPQPAFTCKQASSYDRAKIAPGKPGWFANNDQGQFIRDEENNGRKERVMLDAEGPGCLVRFWLTTVKNRKGTLRIYLDDQSTPTLSFPAYDLLSGDLSLGEPFALPHPGYRPTENGGNTLMLPIPYAKHCKVTWGEASSGPRYYQINYRTYVAGTPVQTFTRDALEAARPLLVKAGNALLSPPDTQPGQSRSLSEPIAASKSLSLQLPAGPAAVRQLELRVEVDDAAKLERALRSTIVQMQFDGEDTVWCPAGDFFGSGVGLNTLSSWYRTVNTNGTMICRWVMPYAQSARVTIANVGGHPVKVHLRATTSPWTWDDRSLHFHTAWHHEAEMPTPPYRDWNYVRIAGRGVYVGDTLALFNPVATWYGEGDEKIWVDGESFPSHLGTGTEDYYNFSFAPRGIMQTPFANQVRVDQKMTQGHNVLTRTRNLDGIPFEKSLSFDMELMPWKPMKVTYAATTYWYAFPGATSNVQPQPAAAAAPVPTLADAENGLFNRILDTSENPFLLPDDREAGDPFPVYWDGVWHLYTLRAGPLDSVAHLTSTDLVHWTEKKSALTGGGIATGTVLRHDGRYFMFFTAPGQQVSLVTSDNPDYFDRNQARIVATPDGKRYSKKHFRDPYVFYNTEDTNWWMLVDSQLPGRPTELSASVGLFKSKDLLNWEAQEPLFEPLHGFCASCPQMFQVSNRWYLTYLRRSTLYRTAARSSGPWERGPTWEYNGFMADAGSRLATDGRRWISWAFLGKRFSPETSLDGYGGPLGVGRELGFKQDGSITVRPLPELVAAVRKNRPAEDLFAVAKELSGEWKPDRAANAISCLDPRGGVMLFDLSRENPDYYFEADLEFEALAPELNVVVRTTREFDRGYRVALFPNESEFEVREFSERGRKFNSRTYDFRKQRRVNLKIFVGDGFLETYLNDESDLIARIQDQSGTKLAVQILDSKAVMKNPALRYFKGRAVQ